MNAVTSTRRPKDSPGHSARQMSGGSSTMEMTPASAPTRNRGLTHPSDIQGEAVPEPTRPVRRQKCADCGAIIRARGTRCRTCKTEAFRRTDEIALTGGEWVVRKGVRYWTGPRPTDPPEFHGDVLETFDRTLMDSKVQIVHEKTDPTFCVCGCWLLNEHEDCPACMARVEWLPWAVKAEAQHNSRNFCREMGQVA